MKRFAIVVALVAVCGCKKKPGEDTNNMTGSAGSSSTGSATVTPPPAPAPAPDAAAVAPPAGSGAVTLPAGAQQIDERGAHHGDATALGNAVTVQFIDKLGAENDGQRRVDEMLVLTGASAMVVQIAYDSDDAGAHTGAADDSLSANPPLSPPRPFGKDDATVAKNMLPFTGPLLYLRHGTGGEVAVAHVDDTITVWRLMVLHGEGAEGTVQDWFVQAKIKLAPGATVTAR